MLKHLRLLVFLSVVLAVGFAGTWHSVSGQSVPVADEFANLHFRSIGPASMSGRITDLAVYEPNPAIYYVATAHGGVWKTTSGGAMYEPQLQKDGPMSVGAVAVSQKDPNLAWAGKGEANNRQSGSWGDGIYKTTDGGRTWRNMGLRNSKHIARIVIDPSDNNIVFVAAMGSVWGGGGDRGVYKSTDGGANWKLVLRGANEYTGATDLVMAATNRNVMYASLYQRQRSQCCFNGGGPGSGIYKSTDNGDTWTKLTPIPSGNMGRSALAVYRSSANLLYALIEAEAAGGAAAADPAAGGGRGGGAGGGRGGGGGGASQNGLYRSDDGGTSWRRVSTANPRPMYFSQVRIDPANPDRVYLGGVGLHMTNDGGTSMATDAALVIHDDIHAIWINPTNPNHLLIGGDGGVAVSLDMSRTWTQHHNLPLALYYHVSVDNATPYNVCGGLQDNYNWCGPSAVRFGRGIKNTDWYQVQGGDGFVVLQDPRDERYVFSESQDGNIQRRNRITGEARNIRPNFNNVSPAPAPGSPNFRWNWDTPMVFSPNENGALLVAANRVFRSNDRGDSWAVISPDLTTNTDRNEMTIMGQQGSVPMLSKNDGISMWPTIVSLAESPKAAGVYFTGTDDGVVSMSKDAGKTWERITNRLPGFPRWGYVSEVVPSRFDANTVYVTVDAHRENDFNTYIWASTDQGATFRSINANLQGEVVRTLLEDTRNADVLYAGTETGIFVTLDRGKSWRRLQGRNFPNVRVDEMVIHPRDNALVVGTHGRGIWILDHLAPVQELAASQASAADARLFPISPATQFRMWDNQNDEFWGHHFFLGENPATDAVIQFYVKKPLTDPRLKITDAAGKEIRELIIPSNRNTTGVQTICWDMRVQPIGPNLGPGGGDQPAAGGPGGGGRAGGGRAAGGGGAVAGAAGGGGGAAAAQAGRAGGGPPGGGAGGGGAFGGGQAGPGGGLTGIPTNLPPSGVDAFNVCAGGGGGGIAGPMVYAGNYTVTLTAGGKAIESKTIRIAADPSTPLNDMQAKRYFDVAMDLHEMQRRAMDTSSALSQLSTSLSDVAAKVPDALKGQFDATSKEVETVRTRFGVGTPAAPPAGGGRGGGAGGGGFGGGGGGSNDIATRISAIKQLMLSFQDAPSDTLIRQYTEAKGTLAKTIAEANAAIVKAMTLSQALAKHSVEVKVPAPIK